MYLKYFFLLWAQWNTEAFDEHSRVKADLLFFLSPYWVISDVITNISCSLSFLDMKSQNTMNYT